ncbi:MAG TPA: IS4 family transposase, partial [Nitrospirae bacterium]|nr:IS4 family transposase [Nitrospirota bacterium]
AELEIRFAEVKLKPPQGKKELGELSVFAIVAEEIDVHEGVQGLRWILLTTCEVRRFEQAIEKLQWYCLRWGIEIYHRTLKSGCKIEQRQLGSAERIETCLAIDMVVAWRIYHLTKLGRETPDVACTVFFEDTEWKALVAYKTQNPIPPEKPPTLREAMHMVASLGGFLGRKSDGEPGTQTLWLGLQRLDDMTGMWKVFMSRYELYSLRSPPPVSRPKCG